MATESGALPAVLYIILCILTIEVAVLFVCSEWKIAHIEAIIYPIRKEVVPVRFTTHE